MTGNRKKKPALIAVTNDNCTGCAGSPVCINYCPVDECMYWIDDEDHPPFGRRKGLNLKELAARMGVSYEF